VGVHTPPGFWGGFLPTTPPLTRVGLGVDTHPPPQKVGFFDGPPPVVNTISSSKPKTKKGALIFFSFPFTLFWLGRICCFFHPGGALPKTFFHPRGGGCRFFSVFFLVGFFLSCFPTPQFFLPNTPPPHPPTFSLPTKKKTKPPFFLFGDYPNHPPPTPTPTPPGVPPRDPPKQPTPHIQHQHRHKSRGTPPVFFFYGVFCGFDSRVFHSFFIPVKTGPGQKVTGGFFC